MCIRDSYVNQDRSGTVSVMDVHRLHKDTDECLPKEGLMAMVGKSTHLAADILLALILEDGEDPGEWASKVTRMYLDMAEKQTILTKFVADFMDTDSNGKLSRSEVRSFFSMMGEDVDDSDEEMLSLVDLSLIHI
eukprot:TRINITY_DN16932_c0_g1_i1.p1 TRINITY_DN16932_c0_g1~~TRINITY_DN16932_c0_g1_i1.p1  ORF type:complete len:135 (+),score=35.35 TRINITY_DN16932_c0_g1_i1:92-496(+)